MGSLIKLKKDESINISYKIVEYLNPDFICVPVLQGSNINVNQDEYVLKGQVLSEGVYSPVSGNVIGVKKMIDCHNDVLECIVIDNDFKEKRFKKLGTKKHIANLSADKASMNLSESGIEIDFNNISTLVVNAVESEPHMMTEHLVLYEHVYEVLETIDALSEIYNINTVILAVSESAHELVNRVMDHLGMFPKIYLKLIPDVYPIHHDKLLLNHLRIKEDVSVIKASTAYVIYNSLKKGSKPDTKVITICGNALEESKVVEVKLGTEVKKLIDEKMKVIDNNYLCLVNGLLSRKLVDINNLIVTEDLSSIIIVRNEAKETRDCLNCGSCVEICPYGVNPKLVMDTYNEEKKYNTNVENCSGCGLCSYVCPANRNLNKYLQGRKKDE